MLPFHGLPVKIRKIKGVRVRGHLVDAMPAPRSTNGVNDTPKKHSEAPPPPRA